MTHSRVLPILIAVVLIGPVAAVHAEWAEQAKVTASDAAVNDRFGLTVSISGSRAIAGAHFNGDAGEYSGSAYIYEQVGGQWQESAKLVASDAAAGRSFGFPVALSGDHAIIGSYQDDHAGTKSGSAYVFSYTGGSWAEQAKLTASDAEADDAFGSRLAISGDYAIVGAYGNDQNGLNAGAAYVFYNTGTSWVQQAKLTPADAEADDVFGWAVSISGDYAVVGAYGDDDDGAQSGSAYVFHRSGETWTEQAKLVASDAASQDVFGYSVAVSGDHAIVGALYDDDSGSESGSAYVFERSGSTWTEQSKLTASDAAAGDWFAWGVAISGDQAIVGAGGDQDAGEWTGAAYVFGLDDDEWLQQAKLTASDMAGGDQFGYGVSIDDGYAIVGAQHNGGTGAAYIYAVPEPATMSLLALGGVALLRRKR